MLHGVILSVCCYWTNASTLRLHEGTKIDVLVLKRKLRQLIALGLVEIIAVVVDPTQHCAALKVAVMVESTHVQWERDV